MNSDTNTGERMPDVFLSVKPSGRIYSFDSGYAMAYGMNEALMINTFQWLIGEHEINGENYHDGRHWMCSTLAEFPLHFPFWTVDQVRYILKSLIKQKIIIVGCFNEAWSDRSSWYSFQDYEQFVVTHAEKRKPRKILTIRTPQSKSADLPKSADAFGKIPKCIRENSQMASGKSPKCIIQSSLLLSSIRREDIREEREEEERRKEKQEKEKTPESGMPNPNSETAGQEKTPESRSPELGARVADAPLIADAIGTNSVAPLAKSKKRSEFTSKTFEVVQAIITILAANNDAWKPPTNLNSYLDEIQLMLKDSKITSDNIITVMQWAVEEPFWGPILYGQKNVVKYFRSKFAGWSKAANMTGKKPRQFSPCSDDASALKEFTQKHRVIT